MGITETVDFLETLESCEIKVGTYSPLHECMMIYDFSRSRSFDNLFFKVTQNSNISNTISSDTTGLIVSKFYMELLEM